MAPREPGPPSRRCSVSSSACCATCWRPARRRHGPADARRHHAAHDVVLEEGTHSAAPLPRETPATHAEPVLLCYALVNRPYILDLQPDKSVVRQYLDRGFDVYMIDWGVPSAADRGLTLEDYVCGFLDGAVDFIRREHDAHEAPPPGLLHGRDDGRAARRAGARHAEDADPAGRPDRLQRARVAAEPVDRPPTFDVDAFIDAHGNCPAWFLQSCFQFMKPIRNFVDKAIAFCEQMDDPSSDRQLLRDGTLAQRQHPGGRRNVPRVRQEAVSAQRAGARRASPRRPAVDLGRITCPLLLLTAEERSPGGAGVDGRHPPHVGSRDVTSMGIERRARRPGRRGQGARDVLAGGDALDGRAFDVGTLEARVAYARASVAARRASRTVRERTSPYGARTSHH